MKSLFLAITLSFISFSAFAEKKIPSDINLIRVYKSEHRLELVNRGNYVIKSYKIMLGGNPVGHKTQEGDGKTPEGVYTLDSKNPNSKFHLAIHISYPNAQDKAQAAARKVSPGGDIMIHGIPNSFKDINSTMESIGLGGMSDEIIKAVISNFDWTNGCIALLNNDMKEVYNMIDVPTRIEIYP